MIDEEAMLEEYGYTSDTLSYGTRKLVVAICDGCGERRDISFRSYRKLCIRCAHINPSDETRKKMSDSRKGKKVSDETKNKISVANTGNRLTDATKKKLSVANTGKHHTDATKKKLSEVSRGENHQMYGKYHSEESKKKMSATHQGISYEDWESYATDSLYCPKFNEACRESNREKYGRECFICGKSEEDNIRKLSVHHVDMKKSQGCDGVRWKLVPVCMHCHGMLHTELWESRIIYLLNDVIDCEVGT